MNVIDRTNETTTKSSTTFEQNVRIGAQYVKEADHLLIVAGAGMSVYIDEEVKDKNVYVDKKAFSKHYPDMISRGYTTAYQAMGLFSDPRFKSSVKWGYQARHMDNMGWTFAPNKGYDLLKAIAEEKKSYFVWTSNVDGAFRRSGFDPERIYTPQGEWRYYQCVNRCTEESVWPSRPMLDRVLPCIDSNLGHIQDEKAIPRCKECGGPTYGNVRGGRWFNHSPYLDAQKALRRWAETRIRDGEIVAVLEIGCGFNTPFVTRLPAQSFARELGDRGRFVRINPQACDVPKDLPHATGIKNGWGVLKEIARLQPTTIAVGERPMKGPTEKHSGCRENWRDILNYLAQ